jgi:hypothetical protein
MTMTNNSPKGAPVTEEENKEKKYETLKEFWPYYLSEHQHPVNRASHFIGSAGALFWLGKSIKARKPSYLLLALLNGYGFAWLGHFFIEKNRPATFKHPLKSFVCDWAMFACILSGKIEQEMKKVTGDE